MKCALALWSALLSIVFVLVVLAVSGCATPDAYVGPPPNFGQHGNQGVKLMQRKAWKEWIARHRTKKKPKPPAPACACTMRYDIISRAWSCEVQR